MLVVVTGASGFIGSHVRAWLAFAGYDVIGMARRSPGRSDLLSFDPRSDTFHDVLRRGPDVLVHAAGTSEIGESFVDPRHDFQGNTNLYLDVLEAVRKSAPGCRVVLISSAAVYGDPVEQPVRETASIAPISPYGYHKAMAEQLGQMYHRVFGLQTCALRVFSAYGPGLRRQVVYDAIRLLQASSPARPAVFRGTGRESRDFLHVEDLARGVEAVFRGAQWSGEPYNLASGTSVTIAELVEIVRAELGPRATARFNGEQTRGHPRAWQADITRIQALGFRPAWTLQRGIAQLVRSWNDEDPNEAS